MPVVHCAKRKEKKCKEANEQCVWENDKCKSKNEPLPTKVKKIKCSLRKEAACKKVPETCEWDGLKCAPILKQKTPSPIPGKNIKCGLRKEEACKKVPETCEWNGIKCVTKNKIQDMKPLPPKEPLINVHPKIKVILKKKKVTASPVKVSASPVKVTTSPVKVSASPVKVTTSPDATFLKSLQDLPKRHCFYYSADKKKTFHRDPLVNINGKLKEEYDDSYVPPTNVHIGQRKLLLSEIQLLTTWYQEHNYDPIVVYIGAAPGTHLILLSYLFPNVFFILYDGAKFDKTLSYYPNIYELHEGKDGFVDTKLVHNIAKRFNNKNNIILISDIRLGADDKSKFEKGVTEDMKSQQEWMEILRPQMSLLKFRMSYNLNHGDRLNYTKGDILYQIWPKDKSGETRLLVRKKDIGNKIDYDFKDYEQTMFFHNKYKRPFCYSDATPAMKKYIFSPHNVYCPCYDCLAELTVLDNYSKVMNQNLDNIIHFVASHMNKEKIPIFQTKGLKLPVPALKAITPNAPIKN